MSNTSESFTTARKPPEPCAARARGASGGYAVVGGEQRKRAKRVLSVVTSLIASFRGVVHVTRGHGTPCPPFPLPRPFASDLYGAGARCASGLYGAGGRKGPHQVVEHDRRGVHAEEKEAEHLRRAPGAAG